MAIVHPVRHKLVYSRQLVHMVVACVWVIGLVFALCVNINVTVIIGEHCMVIYRWGAIALPMSWVNFILKMLIPIIVFVVCNVRIFKSLQNKVHGVSQTSQSQEHRARASRNVALTVMYTLILHTASWTGYQVVVLMSAFGFPLDISTVMFKLLLLLNYVTSCINPVIYVYKYKELRVALVRVIRNKKKSADIETGMPTNLSVFTAKDKEKINARESNVNEIA